MVGVASISPSCPSPSELRIEPCSGENRVRARLLMGVWEEDRDGHAEEPGQPFQIGNGRLYVAVSQREIVLAVVFTACANSFVEVGAFHAESAGGAGDVPTGFL